MSEQYIKETNSLDFNSSFELGLRALSILNEIYPRNIDLRRLLIYDYLIIHSSDIEGGPPSLHPSIPNRSNGILIRRKILQEGLNLMYSKNLITIIYDNSGISYKASKLTKPFLDLFKTTYLRKLKANARWVINNFESFNDDDINKYIETHLVEWGEDYVYEFLNEEEVE
ncbi:ABC-three component system middle component 2 [Exiguobacterium sp. NG55]|uniref:ABC-three component system middle component 2 n=1 Tax=Exiguobacterium sp. NG55 TaxID=375477 RepID=UPI00126861D4|nr:ABC-three component system middle component 2 [Exiguobacterium sp. NG55]